MKPIDEAMKLKTKKKRQDWCKISRLTEKQQQHTRSVFFILDFNFYIYLWFHVVFTSFFVVVVVHSAHCGHLDAFYHCLVSHLREFNIWTVTEKNTHTHTTHSNPHTQTHASHQLISTIRIEYKYQLDFPML